MQSDEFTAGVEYKVQSVEYSVQYKVQGSLSAKYRVHA